MMTPEEFYLKMVTLLSECTPDGWADPEEEVLHIRMDDLMCDLLKELGYEKGVGVFERAPKWYS